MHKHNRYTGIALAFITAILVTATPGPAFAGDADMLYLVQFKATEAGSPMTREQAVNLLETLVIPSLESLAKDNRIRAGGVSVGARAGAFVVAAKSNEEVTQLLRALPAWGVWEWEVTPLESFAYRAGLETKILQGLRAPTP